MDFQLSAQGQAVWRMVGETWLLKYKHVEFPAKYLCCNTQSLCNKMTPAVIFFLVIPPTLNEHIVNNSTA